MKKKLEKSKESNNMREEEEQAKTILNETED